MTFCSSSLRLAMVSAAMKMVLGVTGRQKVLDSSATICSAWSSVTPLSSTDDPARGVVRIEQHVDPRQLADGL